MAEIDEEFKNAIGDYREESEPEGAQQSEGTNEQPTAEPRMTPQQEAATVGAIVDFAGALVAKVKHVPSELTPQFLADYHSMADPLLTLIGFGSALSKMPISSLSPTKTVMIGTGMLVVAAIFTRAPQVQQQRQPQRPPSQEQAQVATDVMRERVAQQTNVQNTQSVPANVEVENTPPTEIPTEDRPSNPARQRIEEHEAEKAEEEEFEDSVGNEG